MLEINEELRQELGNTIAAYSRVLTRAYLGLGTPGFCGLGRCFAFRAAAQDANS